MSLSQSLPQPEVPLRLVETRTLDARLSEQVFESPAMQRQMRVRVLFPTGYGQNGSGPFPVLYLLHGCCSNGRGYAGWTEDFDLHALTEALDVVVVMPEAGEGGLYSDWYNHGQGGPPRWETFHVRELMPWVEANLRVRRDRQGRLLLGISMGGHGAMAYAARYPQYFGSAAAVSPTVDTNVASSLLGLGALLDGGDSDAIWGPRSSEELRWRGHNPLDLAANLGTLNLFLVSGDGREPGSSRVTDVAEQVVAQMSQNLHEQWQRLGVQHEFVLRSPGTHQVEFWDQDLQRLLPQLVALASPTRPDPQHFTYRSIEPEFEVFGWRLGLSRQVAEFVELQVQGDDGFVLSGSGQARVRTAAWYRPQTAYQVAHADESRTEISDAQGRLHIDVDLGPSRQVQQFRRGSEAGFLRAVSVSITPYDP